MKKSIIFFILILLSQIIFSKDLTLNNGKIKIDINISENNNIIISQITDPKTGQTFLKEADREKSLWYFKVKKSEDYNGDAIILYPIDAEKLVLKLSNTRFEGTWLNVKKTDMDNGFDVKITVNLSGQNSYWNIDIMPNTEKYGVWSVFYPYISKMSTENGDNFALPIRGGSFVKQFSDKGFIHSYFEDDRWTDILEYGQPMFMQFECLTKGKSSLYLCAEDLKNNHRWLEHRVLVPYTCDYIPECYPLFMAKAGEKYHQEYPFNISVLQGDWYDACKKYRKWGIKNNYGPFALGKLDERKDIPEWWKHNCACMYYVGFESQCTDSLEETMKILDVPMMVHAYCYNEHPMDTHYPNWLPLNDHWLSDFERIKKAGYNVIIYTNGHLVDTALSDYYKKYGDVLVNKYENGEMFHEPWAEDKGAYNVVACPDSEYKNVYGEEIKNLMKSFLYDGLYMDQVSAAKPELCFNELHSTHKGGGDHWTRAYRENINRYRKELNEIKNGDPVIIVTEDSTDAYPFDAWLRVNENISRNIESPMNTVVYSGYANSFGDSYYPQEYTEMDSQPAINRTSATFSKGIMPGWNTGYAYEFSRYPNLAKHFKNMAKGRAKAYEYFNLGEMVRDVEITSEIPYKNLYWKHYTTDGYKDFPLLRTCSFNYKGKTAVSFISSSFEEIKVDWQAKAKDLNLPIKNIYNIKEFYPNTEETVINKCEKGTVKSSFTLKPLETVIFIVD